MTTLSLNFIQLRSSKENYMKIRFTLGIVILLSFSSALARSEEKKLPEEQLPALVATAVANNPELKASESRWQMLASKVKQASALEDPMVMFKLQNVPARNPLFSTGIPNRPKSSVFLSNSPSGASELFEKKWPGRKPSRINGQSKSESWN